MTHPRVSPETTIVFITGASTGLGLQISRILSKPSLHKDYHIIIGSLTTTGGEDAVAQLLADDPTRSLSTVTIDVTSDESIATAYKTIEHAYGRIDVLFNNAGVLLDGLDTPTASRALFERTFQVNLFGAAAVTDAFVPLLENSTSLNPRIVFMTSRLGSLATKADSSDRSAARFFPAYRSSKCALNMLMLHYAGVFASRGWKVNGCDPGLTATALAGDQKNMGSVEDGAMNACRLATLGAEGETGTFSNKEGLIKW